MRYLVDNLLPIGLAQYPRERGCQADHVTEWGLGGATDSVIAARAQEWGAVMISKDEDFVHLVISGVVPALVWIRLGNCRNPVLFAAIDRLWPQVEARIAAGERLVALES